MSQAQEENKMDNKEEERVFVPTGHRRRNSSLRKSGSSLKASAELYRKKSTGSFVMSTIRTVKIKEVVQGMGYIYKKTSEWGSKFPEANGNNQSPINISSKDAIYDRNLASRPLALNYVMCRETDICNNGHTVVACLHNKSSDSTFINDLMPSSIMSGGPFDEGHEYELTEFRFHWGKQENRGSEHTVNCKAFPMELHLIHYNSTLFGCFEEAVGHPKGVAIIALFVQVGKEHPGLKTLTDQLEDIQYKGRQKTITAAFNPICLLPDEMLRDYWTYTGSFTSPPCNEQVSWIIFRYPLTISFNQIEEFRRLRTHHKGEFPAPEEDGALVDNFRPTQPINDRSIFASFHQ